MSGRGQKPKLARREVERLVELRRQGQTYSTLAARFGISMQTARNYVENASRGILPPDAAPLPPE